MTRLIVLLLGIAPAAAHANPSQIMDLGQMSGALAGEADAFALIVTVLCFVLALCMAMLGISKLNAAQDPRNNASSRSGFLWLFLAAMMAALPATINLGVGTMFGGQVDTLSGSGRPSLLEYR